MTLKFKGHSHCSVTASTKEKAKKAKNKRVFFKTKAEIKSDTVEKLMWRLHLDHCHPSGHQFIIISQSIPFVNQVPLGRGIESESNSFFTDESEMGPKGLKFIEEGSQMGRVSSSLLVEFEI